MRVCPLCHRCYDDPVFSCTDESHPPLSDTRHGSPEMIAGYRLDVLLESGVKGEIYRARQTAVGRSCLIRVVAVDEKNKQQFLDDAKLAAAFFHPNVVDVYDVGSLDSGEGFVVTEDPDGETLRAILKKVGVPELLTTIQIVRQAAEALHAIHLKGLKHRAVNPENIILTTDADGRLLVRIKDPDFGGVAEQSIVSNKFLIDSALDMLRYFAPEQCTGGAVSIKTDVYALGIVLYEMLAGAPPFDAPKAAGLIEKHRNERPPDIRIDDFELRMLVTHALMESLIKQAERRQSSANAFARQLRHIEQLATHVSTPPPVVAVPAPPPRTVVSASTRLAVTQPVVAVAEQPKAIYAENLQPVISGIEHEPISALRVESELQASVFEVESEPIAVIDAEPPSDEIPVISESPVEEPAIQSSVMERTPSERLARLKLRRRKSHPTPMPPAPEISINEPLPLVEPVPVNRVEPRAVLTETAAVPVVPVKTEAVSLRREPAKIASVQPEDDIPSEAQVLEILAKEQKAEAPIVLAKEQKTQIPIVHSEPKVITAAPRRSRPIRIDLEKTAAPKPLSPRKKLPRASEEPGFFPTMLGDRRGGKTVDPNPGDSMFSAFYGHSKARFSSHYRSLAAGGGGIAAMIFLFLISDDLVGRFASAETPRETIAARTIKTDTSIPQAVQPNGVTTAEQTAYKNFRQPTPEDSVEAADRSTTFPAKKLSRLSTDAQAEAAVIPVERKQSPKAAAVNGNRGKTRDNTKTKPVNEVVIRTDDKKPPSVPNKTSGTTRPRIVENPKP